MTIRLYTLDELLAFPEPEWLVEPFLVDGALSIMFGPSSVFKSTLAVDWAARAPGRAIYISAEGSPRRFGERVAAWEEAAGATADLRCVPHSLDLIDRETLDELCFALNDEPPRLVIVDTAARNSSGDENSTQDMGKLVAATDTLRARFGCAVLVIHHTGLQNTDRERGSSALRGAADVSIRVKRGDGLQARLECAKMRDGEEFQPLVVRLEPVAGALVACRPVTAADSIEEDVRRYLADHPEASQNEVEAAVTGKAVEIRAAYKKVRPLRPDAGRTPGQGASRVVPLKGTRTQPLNPTLDPDEHVRAIEDGGW